MVPAFLTASKVRPSAWASRGRAASAAPAAVARSRMRRVTRTVMGASRVDARRKARWGPGGPSTEACGGPAAAAMASALEALDPVAGDGVAPRDPHAAL